MTAPDRYETIVAREFRTALGLAPIVPVTVVFTPDERIVVTINNHHQSVYVMQIGSDDDEFYFKSLGRNVVRFPMPADWPED